MPAITGSLPSFYNGPPTFFQNGYLDSDATPVHPFGYDTQFVYENVDVFPKTISHKVAHLSCAMLMAMKYLNYTVSATSRSHTNNSLDLLELIFQEAAQRKSWWFCASLSLGLIRKGKGVMWQFTFLLSVQKLRCVPQMNRDSGVGVVIGDWGTHERLRK